MTFWVAISLELPYFHSTILPLDLLRLLAPIYIFGQEINM